MEERIKEIEIQQASEMIFLNEEFYTAMDLLGEKERAVVSRRILKAANILEVECMDLRWIPYLYSIIARCHFDLGDIEKAIIYSRDGLLLGELEAYKASDSILSIDETNLHSIKTQRDIALGVSDIEKAIQLQERLIEISPYQKDENQMMQILESLKENNADKCNNGAYTGYCEQIKSETPLRRLTTKEEIQKERDSRIQTFLKKEEH